MKVKEFNRPYLLPGSVSDCVLKCLQEAIPYDMTPAEISEATGCGAKAIQWSLYLLARTGLAEGKPLGYGNRRCNSLCLKYRATPPHAGVAIKPKPMETRISPKVTRRFPQELDYSAEPTKACGARTRAGRPCRLESIYWNGRCKFHGGLSTGPKTEAGKEQARINGRKGGRPRKQARNPTS